MSRVVAQEILITFIKALVDRELASVESLKQLNQKVLTLKKKKRKTFGADQAADSHENYIMELDSSTSLCLN